MYFLELDDDDESNNYETYQNKLKEKIIYILHYPKGTYPSISYGKLEEKHTNYSFFHKCNTEKGSSGSPILLKNNKKVIGIHIGAFKGQKEMKEKKKPYNIGCFLKYFFNEINESKKTKKRIIMSKKTKINSKEKNENKKGEKKEYIGEVEIKENARYKPYEDDEKETNISKNENSCEIIKNSLDYPYDDKTKKKKIIKKKKKIRNVSLPHIDNNYKSNEIKDRIIFRSIKNSKEKGIKLPILLSKK